MPVTSLVYEQAEADHHLSAGTRNGAAAAWQQRQYSDGVAQLAAYAGWPQRQRLAIRTARKADRHRRIVELWTSGMCCSGVTASKTGACCACAFTTLRAAHVLLRCLARGGSTTALPLSSCLSLPKHFFLSSLPIKQALWHEQEGGRREGRRRLFLLETYRRRKTCGFQHSVALSASAKRAMPACSAAPSFFASSRACTKRSVPHRASPDLAHTAGLRAALRLSGRRYTSTASARKVVTPSANAISACIKPTTLLGLRKATFW